MYRMLHRTFDGLGLDWTACHHEDRGDGVFVTVPADVPKPRWSTYPILLAGELRTHNTTPEPQQFRLRYCTPAR